MFIVYVAGWEGP